MRSKARKLRVGELLMRPHFRVRCVLEVTLLRSQQQKPFSQYQRKLGGGYWDDDCHRNRHQRSGVRGPGSCESSGCSSATWSPRLAGALSAHARHTRWFVRQWHFLSLPSYGPALADHVQLGGPLLRRCSARLLLCLPRLGPKLSSSGFCRAPSLQSAH